MSVGPRTWVLVMSCAVTGLCALGVLLLPSYVPGGQLAAWWFAGLLGALSLWDALRLIRRRSATTSDILDPISFEELTRLRQSGSNGSIYVGSGFTWSATLAQRYYQLPNDVSPKPNLFGKPSPIFFQHRDFAQHVLTLGTTQCGKTTLNELLSVQAIQDGDPVIIINPKEPGRWLNWAYQAALLSGRADRFHFVSLSHPTASSHYNPLQEFSDASELSDRIVIPLPDSKDAAPYKAFCHKVMRAVVDGLILCKIRPTYNTLLKYSLENMGELLRLVLSKRFPAVFRADDLFTHESLKSAVHDYRERVSKGLLEEDRVVDRLGTLFLHPIDNFQRMTNSLVPYLETMSSDAVGRIMGVEDGDVRWGDVVEDSGIVYFDLAGMKGLLTAEAVGRMIVSDLTSFIGTRYAYYKSRPRVHLFVDELSNVLTKEFLDVLNKAAGSGFRVYAMAQSPLDAEAVLGSRAQARRMTDNIRVKTQMQAADHLSARQFSELCGETDIEQIELSMSTRPAFLTAGHRSVADFEQSQGRKLTKRPRPLVPPDLLQAFPRGTALTKCGPKLLLYRVRALAEPQVDYLRDVKHVVKV